MSRHGRVADAVARTLAAHGITRAFGMPGGEVVALIDALAEAGIGFVLARQETSAAIMAAGAHAATGAPGLLVTTVGPGLANAVNGIADAAQERVPLIVISGVVDRAHRGRYTHQVFDHAALLKPLVKASFEVEAEGASATVARALRLALAEPMGPVHIDLAVGTSGAPCGVEDVLGPVREVVPSPRADDETLGEIRARLGAAKRPLILAGLGAVRAGAGEPLSNLMTRLGAPLITTYKAKGVVSEHHPLALGGAGLSPRADPVMLELARAADVVLLVGYDPIEMRIGWLDPFAKSATIIDISAAAIDHGMHRADVRIGGNVAATLTALADGLAQARTWPDGEPGRARARLIELFTPPSAWGPHAAFDVLQNVLPESATVTVDSGAHRILLSQQMRFSRAGALLQSAGLCTMGAAVPLAIGHAAAKSGGPVVAVLGDGGLEMCLGELGTLRDAGLPVIVMVMQDESLALIELKQAQAGLAERGVRLGRTRYEDVARAFSGEGVRVADRDSLAAALQAALAAKTFTLIVCDIRASDYAGAI